MEVFKKYLDGLPKVGFDYLEENFEEGDTVYRIVGNSGDFGDLGVMKIAEGSKGGLSYYYEVFKTGKIVETPVPDLEYLLHNIGTLFEKLRQKVNDRHNPLLIRDETQRKLAIQRGELIVRYKLVKRNGKEYEILT